MVVLSLLILACTHEPNTASGTTAATSTSQTGSSGGTSGSGTSGSGTSGSGTSSGGTTPGESDEAILRAAIAGERDAAAALLAVSRSGGLPVETETGSYLFACLCTGDDWALAGDHDDWTGASMTRAGDLWWFETTIDTPDGSLYKFTDGFNWIADPLGRRYGTDENGEYSLVRASAPHLERWHQIDGAGLQPRDLQVWVPGDHTHLLLAHDGQNLFDRAAYWGGWRLDESLPDGVLLVGIDNTSDRIDEYTHTEDEIHGQLMGGSAVAYVALIEDTIRPMMEASYGPGDVTGVMGSSLGGLVSFAVADLHPDRYDMVISMSGTMGWGSFGLDNDTMIDVYAGQGRRDVALYLDSGGSGTCFDGDGDGIEDDDPTDSDNYCTNRQLADTLEAEGYVYEEDLWHWHEAGATHDEASWAERVWRPLELFISL